jgi:hypothetical protein
MTGLRPPAGHPLDPQGRYSVRGTEQKSSGREHFIERVIERAGLARSSIFIPAAHTIFEA